MSQALVTRFGWAVAAFSCVLALPTLVLLGLGLGAATPADGFGMTGLAGLSFLLAFLVFSVVGALVIVGAPDNAIGPLFCLMGLIGTAGTFAYQYADFSIYVSPGSLPGGAVFAWLQNLGAPPAFGLVGLALLLFPDGRLPSARWRPAAWVAWLGISCIVLAYTFRPGPLDFPFEGVDNPLGVDGLRSASDGVSLIGWMLMAGAVGLGGIATTLRFRRSAGVARQQLKWISLAGVLAGIVIVASAATYVLLVTGIDTVRFVLIGLAFAGIPVAAGIAILRYRLYDIDLVVNRALVYAALTATLAATYVGGVLLLQFALSPLTQESELAVAGSTLAVAALFRPARAWIQASVDRRFYRNRYDVSRTLAAFSTGLRDEVDLHALADKLRDVVGTAMQPTHVSLWLKER